jgi:hypothetical protein
MTLGELITGLIEIDLDHPGAADEEVHVVDPGEGEGVYWIVVGDEADVLELDEEDA